MNLGELKQTLATLSDDNFVFSSAFTNPHSYRGDYSEVAFEPATGVKLAQIKELIRQASTRTFTGYKGGEYIYKSDTPCNLAYWGSSGDNAYGEFEELVKSMVEEYVAGGQPLKEKKMAKETSERN